MPIKNFMNKAKAVLVGTFCRTRPGFSVTNSDLRCQVEDFEEVRLARAPKQKGLWVIIDPVVITNRLDVLDDQRGRFTARERKLPETLRAVSFDAHDRNILLVGHQCRRVLAFGGVRNLRGRAGAKVVSINIGLLVSD